MQKTGALVAQWVLKRDWPTAPHLATSQGHVTALGFVLLLVRLCQRCPRPQVYMLLEE